ncbi:glutaredoxin 3 [Pseudorhodoplanes sinuspersici]|uniref:Glutaredoxin n=1 Tax=Pseudorhodoplanes sinuspersici TaxID=1235591 RepID=A0A1W6ZR16_9HYPH|nr:glutaredoxin 3 [Pseudorhodoplanes sinuspersici]ARP99811.1 glutaredoxin 3 [Pseudorhodoplanes sinuspersici]RKE70819.1 glutaredoxin 3 [Pseudorhodoplanes sinuspersici]
MSQKVEIYTSRYCPYCKSAKMLLARKGIPFEEIDIAANGERLEEMITRSGGVAIVPQIFLGEWHVGDSRMLEELDRRGELERLLPPVTPD